MKHQIDPEKYYTRNAIQRLRLFPWISSDDAIRRYIEFDLGHDNLLKTIVKPAQTPSGVRFFIKGENIIKLLAAFEDGTLFLNPRERNKNYGRGIKEP